MPGSGTSRKPSGWLFRWMDRETHRHHAERAGEKMNVIEWLLEGDLNLQYLTAKYLLDQPLDHGTGGYIDRYLDLYDEEFQGWGGGIYSPKWISSTYTLLELKYLEIQPDHPFYQAATRKTLDGLWPDKGWTNRSRYQDLCVAAMVLSLVCYGRIRDERTEEIIDFILAHQMGDGGWNCAWDSSIHSSTVGSVHTTMSVLEALADYETFGYTCRLPDAQLKRVQGEEYLLSRRLVRSLRTGEIIHPDLVTFHYPCRWKYDCFRALEYFARSGHPYDERMQEALRLVHAALQKGYVNRGKRYSGLIHFPLESGRQGRFNTFRALLILKQYDSIAYRKILRTDFRYQG